jgi:hypothetical protein
MLALVVVAARAWVPVDIMPASSTTAATPANRTRILMLDLLLPV